MATLLPAAVLKQTRCTSSHFLELRKRQFLKTLDWKVRKRSQNQKMRRGALSGFPSRDWEGARWAPGGLLPEAGKVCTGSVGPSNHWREGSTGDMSNEGWGRSSELGVLLGTWGNSLLNPWLLSKQLSLSKNRAAGLLPVMSRGLLMYLLDVFSKPGF